MDKFVKPKISVLTANYNNGLYLAEAIDSVLNQTFKNWELVIFDDCSTDNSIDIAEKYLDNKRIKLLKNKKNTGYIGALKSMISEAEADIIGILDSDDALAKDALEKIISAYDKHPECGFIYSQFIYCSWDMSPIKKGFCQSIPEGKSNIHCLYTSHFKTFKKEAYRKTSGYDERILYAEDTDLVLKMEEATKLFFVDEILYKYRILPKSQTHDHRKSVISKISHTIAKYDCYKRRKNGNLPNLSRLEMSMELIDCLLQSVKLGDCKKVKFFSAEVLKLYPLNIKGYFWILYRVIKFIPYRIGKKFLKEKYGAK